MEYLFSKTVQDRRLSLDYNQKSKMFLKKLLFFH